MLRTTAFSSILAVSLLVAATVSAVPPPTTYYRSIGSAPNYNLGTVTVINGETSVIGSSLVNWLTANRGKGDRIQIEGMDYTILSVDAENELTLTDPYVGSTKFDATYDITRKFVRFKDWVSCISSGGCPGAIGPDLATDGRIEVGVAYKDSPFVLNPLAAEVVWLDNMVTDATHTITLTVTPPNRHHGVESTGVILDNVGNATPAIRMFLTGYVTIEWIEIHHGDTADQIFVSNVGAQSQIKVNNVIFHDDDQEGVGFHVNDQNANVLFLNNVLYGLDDGVYVDGLVNPLGRFEFLHNTFFNNNVGLLGAPPGPANNAIVLNGNLAVGNAVDFNAITPVAPPASGNNVSLDATAPLNHWGMQAPVLQGAGGVNFVSVTAPEDLHIIRDSFAIDKSSFLSPVTDDLDGRFRGPPDVGADEADTSSANPVKVLTAMAADSFVQLEWQHPDYGPMQRVEIWRDTSTFPAQPGIGSLACTLAAPSPGTRGACADALSPANGTQYYYSAFVMDFSFNWSTPTNVKTEPFDTIVNPPEWSYATGAATFEPAGVRSDNAFVVSNDRFLHAMHGGAGDWPAGPWKPYELPALVQHRPVIVDVQGVATALLSGQDARVYAVSTITGRLVWKSEVLGTSIAAAPAALVELYGATGASKDTVYVGTSHLSSNTLHVLDLQTGAKIAEFNDVGNPDNIGAISGVGVKYPAGPVFFTSADGSGATPRNVWSLNVAGLPSPPTPNWSDNPGPIDSGPTRYNNLIVVGTRNGRLIAYDEAGTAPLWATVPLGDGAIKSPIFPVWPNDTVVFSTNTVVHSYQIAATGGCLSAPCLGWTDTPGPSPSPPLVVPGSAQMFVGLGDGRLIEYSLDLVTPMNPPTQIRPFQISLTSALGSPAFSSILKFVYVSDSSGKVHGVAWPIP